MESGHKRLFGTFLFLTSKLLVFSGKRTEIEDSCCVTSGNCSGSDFRGASSVTISSSTRLSPTFQVAAQRLMWCLTDTLKTQSKEEPEQSEKEERMKI